MGVVDRTNEFADILGHLSGTKTDCYKNQREEPQQADTAQSGVNKMATEISDHVDVTAVRVAELKKQVKSTALFNDKTSTIQELFFYIQEDLKGLEIKIAKFEDHVKHAQARQVHQDHSVNMVGILRMRLGEVTKDAKVAHEEWTLSMQRQQNRKQMLSTPRPIGRNIEKSGRTLEDVDGGHLRQRTMTVSQTSISRMEAVQQVQRRVAELGQMFTHASTFVQQQEDMIARIDDELVQTQEYIDQGEQELLKYWHRLSSNRQLIFKVFGILMVFVVFFVLFLSD
jgi:syntaxin 5